MRARFIWRIVAALAIVAMLFSANLGAAEALDRPSPVIGSVENLAPGDILFMRNFRDAWSRYSYWTHNSIYVGAYGGCQHGVIEAVSQGVSLNCLENGGHWWQRADFSRAVGYVPTTGAAAAAVAYAIQKYLDGTPYDFFLNRDTDARLYCSELIWRGYLQGNVNVEYYAGRYITPDDERFDQDVIILAEKCTRDGTTKQTRCPTKPRGLY